MKKLTIKKWIPITILLFFSLSLFLMIYKAFPYCSDITDPTQSYETITKVSSNYENKQEIITLPYIYNSLPKQTPVTLTFDVTSNPGSYLYVKSVYAPLKIYCNDTLVYEYGAKGTYPSFMMDPPTSAYFLPLPIDSPATLHIRLEYTSPNTRDSLSLQPFYLGSAPAIQSKIINELGFSFVFSIIMMILGILFVVMSIIFSFFDKKGICFLYLGLFTFGTGCWSFGECDMTQWFIPNPTLLYMMAFLSLFTMLIPLYKFAFTIIEFHKKQILLAVKNILVFINCIAIFLQLIRVVPLSTSMYLFHLLLPISLCIFVYGIMKETIKYHNEHAKKFLSAFLFLAIFTILEVVNYTVRITNLLSVFFQIGVFIFIVLMARIGILYLQSSLRLKAHMQELEYNYALMEKQIIAQKENQELVLSHEEILRKERHDLKHHLKVIQQYNTNGEKALLDAYLGSLLGTIPEMTKLNFCENIAVNALTQYYYSLAKKNGIDIVISLAVPARLEHITDTDLCIIIGNLLENAIEACGRSQEESKYIKLKSRIHYDLLTITMDNSFSNNLVANNGLFLSSKSGKPGIGLQSIQSITEKNQGNARFESKGSVFYSSIYIKL